MHNKAAQDTAKRVLLQSFYTVANSLMHKYSIRVERNHGVISVFANVDILTGHLVAPLFARKLTSIVTEGDYPHNASRGVAPMDHTHVNSVPVEVKWTEAAPSPQLQEKGIEAPMDHNITYHVNGEVRLPREELEGTDWVGCEDLHPFWLINRNAKTGNHNCEMNVKGFKQCSIVARKQHDKVSRGGAHISYPVPFHRKSHTN